jgi:hypothetical protein
MKSIKEYVSILNLNSDLWIWRGDILYYKNIKLFPLLEIEDDIIFLYIDLRLENQFSKLLKILINSDFEFYLVTNELNNPKIKSRDWVNLSVELYFLSLIDHKFYQSYKNLNFDLIKNLIGFVSKYGCIELIWEEYNKALPLIDKKVYHNITGENLYMIPEEIRDNFKSLKRDIQLQLLFSK